MGKMQLSHRKHNIEWSEERNAGMIFLSGYCNDCDEYLGTLNITVILDKMEIGE